MTLCQKKKKWRTCSCLLNMMFGLHFYVPETKSNSGWNRFSWQFSLRTLPCGYHLRCIALHCNRSERRCCRCWFYTRHLLCWQYFHQKITVRRADETENSIPLVDTVRQWIFSPQKKLKYCLEWTASEWERLWTEWIKNVWISITDRKMYSLFMDGAL